MKAQEKILVFCSREICYLSGNFFAHQLAGAFEEAGYETTVCEFTSKDDSYGLKGSNRFLHEIPAAGADTIIIQQGINDIIHPVGTDINPFRPKIGRASCRERV